MVNFQVDFRYDRSYLTVASVTTASQTRDVILSSNNTEKNAETCMRVCVRIGVRASSYFLNNVAAERSEEGNKFQGAVVKYYLPKTSLHQRRLNAAERARCSISERWRSFRRRRASGRLFARLTALLWSSGKATFGKLPYLPVMPHGCGRVIRGP